MAVFRIAKMGDFTTMSNHHLRNRNLSLKAVGLLSKMLSLPDDWDYTLKGLAKLTTDGLDSVRSAVKELEDAGYIVRRQLRDERGRLSKSEYLVFEIPELAKPLLDLPLSENPTTDNPIPEQPITEQPIPGNPTQVNTNQVTTKESNTLLINNPSINPPAVWHSADDGTDRMEERESYRDFIKENIDYDYLRQSVAPSRLDELVEIMVDTVCSTNKTIRINGEDMPQSVVKSRFLKLNGNHIEYVLTAMDKNPADIRNIRAYLLTALYNAPVTMDSFYSAWVNHDLNGGT